MVDGMQRCTQRQRQRCNLPIYSWALEKHPRSHSIVQEEGQILIKRHLNNMYISTVTSPVQQQEGDNLFSIDIV